jgi:hypothetical protein
MPGGGEANAAARTGDQPDLFVKVQVHVQSIPSNVLQPRDHRLVLLDDKVREGTSRLVAVHAVRHPSGNLKPVARLQGLIGSSIHLQRELTYQNIGHFKARMCVRWRASGILDQHHHGGVAVAGEFSAVQGGEYRQCRHDVPFLLFRDHRRCGQPGAAGNVVSSEHTIFAVATVTASRLSDPAAFEGSPRFWRVCCPRSIFG